MYLSSASAYLTTPPFGSPTWQDRGFCSEVSRSHNEGGTCMYTSTLLVALLSVPGAADTPTWATSYSAACKECETAKKPLAVFFGAGKMGYDKVVRDGGLSADSRKQLASGYVPVVIDTSTGSGRRLAGEFDMPSGQGIVISDRTGEVQAFRHEGDLTNTDLNAYLERYASGAPVSTTETIESARTSYAPPAEGKKDGAKEGAAG